MSKVLMYRHIVELISVWTKLALRANSASTDHRLLDSMRLPYQGVQPGFRNPSRTCEDHIGCERVWRCNDLSHCLINTSEQGRNFD